MSTFSTLEDLVTWLKAAPVGTQLDASKVAELLAEMDLEAPTQEPEMSLELAGEWTWAERIWLVPAERRLGTREVLEALGRGRSWLHQRMKPEHGPDRFPHRKLDGELVFAAGEVRAWIRDHEEVVAGGRFDSTPTERGDFNVA